MICKGVVKGHPYHDDRGELVVTKYTYDRPCRYPALDGRDFCGHHIPNNRHRSTLRHRRRARARMLVKRATALEARAARLRKAAEVERS